MSSNTGPAFGRLCRDGHFGNYIVKSKTVIDKEANLRVNNAKMKGDAKLKGDLCVEQNLVVHGRIRKKC